MYLKDIIRGEVSMAEFILEKIGIRGISCAVPSKRIDNTDYYDQFGKEIVDKTIKMTGVKYSYRTPEEQTASDLCFVAAKNLIEKKNVNKDKIGALIFITQTPDYRLPPTACVLHKRLELDQNCMAFDVNLGCSGWVYGIEIVGSLMATSKIDNAILLFGDTSIKTTAPDDRAGVMLFGEAGSATLLEKTQDQSIYGELYTDGNGYKDIIMPTGAYRFRNIESNQQFPDYTGYMDGADVFSFTITQVPKLIKRFPEKVGKSIDDYDAMILHQANLYIMQQISKKTKVPMDKIPVSIDRYGNTSGTSIPITLCDAYGDKSNGDLKLLLCGYGVGLSWGIVDACIKSEDIFPIEITDDYYKDGGLNLD